MKKIDENIEWEKEAPYLASLPRATPYQVPATYFKNLAENLNTVALLANFKEKDNQGFNTPENYFEALTAHLQAQVGLAQIGSKTDGFNAPTNYFENLQAHILAQTAQKNKTVRLWSSAAVKYASAACLIIVSALVLVLNQQSKTYTSNTTELANEQLLYGIDESVIIEHLQEHNTTTNTTDQELENYILNNFSTKDLSNHL